VAMANAWDDVVNWLKNKNIILSTLSNFTTIIDEILVQIKDNPELNKSLEYLNTKIDLSKIPIFEILENI
jgi:hypothetical protein